MVDVRDEDRHPVGGDPAGEALADRDPDALLHLLLDPFGGASDELLRRLIEQQDRNRVDLKRLLHPIQQLLQQLVQAELGQRRIG